MLRALHALGIAPCKRLFEFCSGPGYVGYSLLAYGFCHTLALADLNSAAVEAARATANFNGLQHRVSIYASDGLADIPPDERWDVVVGIPPCTEGTPPPGEIRYHDSDYSIHRRFYADVRHHMRPGGRIVIRESIGEADPRIFEPMIRAGGGRLVTIQTASTLRGERMGLYYVVSEW
jgi:16S rRNA G1207 methylase RsmC